MAELFAKRCVEATTRPAGHQPIAAESKGAERERKAEEHENDECANHLHHHETFSS